MRIIGVIALVLLLYPSISYANLANIQKFRLAKAKLALDNDDHHTYRKLIKINITNEIPHIDSLIHWGDYLFSQKQYSKAFRAYHIVITRLHTDILLETKDNSQLKKITRDIRPPSQKVLQLYLNLADYYLELLKVESFSDAHRKRFKTKAFKYYEITEIFDYQVFYSTYRLGKLLLQEGKRKEAYELLTKAKNIPSDRRDAKQLRDDIELILAESLYYYNKQESSKLYLRGIYQNQTASSSSRDYAKYFYDSLDRDYFGTTFSYLLSQKYNLHELTNIQREEKGRDTFKNEFGVDKGVLNTFNLHTFVNKKLKNRWSALGNLNLSAVNTGQERAKRADRRFLSFGLDFRRVTLRNSLYKLRYQYDSLWSKVSKESPLEANNKSHTFRPEYTFILKSGAMTWGGLYSFISQSIESQAALGVTWSYQSHNRSFLWSPTYSLELITQSEILDQSNSTIINLSFSNPTQLSERWTLFSTIDLTRNSNAESNLDFFQYEFSFAAQRELKILNNLFLDVIFRHSNQSFANDQNIKFYEIGGGCTYNF